MENNNELLEEDISRFTFTDEDGNDVELELLDVVEYQDKEFMVLLPCEDDAEEVLILEVEPQEDGTEEFLTVEDPDVLEPVFNLFKERCKDFFDFVD